MNPLLIPFLATAVLFGAPTLVLGSGNPDFERDAKPILEEQPGLVSYVHTHFVVKETGLARVPGSSDRPPQPPFIFSARPRGRSGPFYLRLLIQPGPEGRILKVADVRQLPPGAPAPPSSPEPSAAVSAPAPSSEPIGSGAPAASPSSATSAPPTSDTPSGPIRD